MNGELIKLKEQRKEVKMYIKELEKDRIKEDICNVDKYKSLYDVYYALDNKIKQIELSI